MAVESQGQKYLNDVIDFHQLNIKNVRFNWCNANLFIKNVMKLKNLESLTLESINFDTNRLYQIKLSELKVLKINYCRNLIDNFKISASKLEQFFIIPDVPSDKLLKRYPNLKMLKFCQTNDEKLEGIKQKLTFLDIYIENKNFINLLESQSESLRELQIDCKNENEEIEFLILNMKILEKLTIRLPEELKELKKSKQTVKELNLKIYHEKVTENYLKVLKNVLKSFSRVEKLQINFLNSYSENLEFETFKIISQYQNIKSLTIDGISGNFHQIIDLSSINFLSTSVKNYSEIDQFINFLLSCVNLKRIKITESDFKNVSIENFKTILANLKNLEEIDAKEFFTLTDEIVELIISGNFKLKRFKLYVERKSFERQKKFAENLSKKSLIQCTIMKI